MEFDKSISKYWVFWQLATMLKSFEVWNLYLQTLFNLSETLEVTFHLRKFVKCFLFR
jgi:hypothetical protein